MGIECIGYSEFRNTFSRILFSQVENNIFDRRHNIQLIRLSFSYQKLIVNWEKVLVWVIFSLYSLENVAINIVNNYLIKKFMKKASESTDWNKWWDNFKVQCWSLFLLTLLIPINPNSNFFSFLQKSQGCEVGGL